MSLLIEIDRFLRRTDMPPTRFGREALNDPRFVFDVRRGRECGGKVRERVRAYIAAAGDNDSQCT